jgi:CRISPR-associated endonuclease/helicase Cas3
MKLPNIEHAKDARLLLWLIGTHHGYGRPFFPHADTQDAETRLGLLSVCGGTGNLESGFGPQSFGFSFEGLDWMQIFEALKASYGVWGLARLEAFVRLADHRASEEDGGLGIAGSQSEAAR